MLRDLDTNQYGAIQKLSTTLPLLDMFYDWSNGTDDWSNGTDIKAVFNYCRAFDLIDHSLLIRKLSVLDVPNSIVKALVIMNFKELATYHDKIRDTF